jgi:LysM repeat protein
LRLGRAEKASNATVVQGLDTPLALYAWPTPAARGGPSVALQLAGQILTQPGSRLAQSSTGSKPLTLAVQSRSLDATGPGALIVSLRIKQGATVDQASKLLDAELQRLARAGPSASELERARSRLGEQLDVQLSNAETRASQLGHYELHDGDAAVVLRQARTFGQVTAAQVAQAAALYLTPTLRTTVELYPRGWPQDPDPPIVRRRHTVKAGDTLIGIAKHYGSTAKAIAKANGLRTRGFIYPGQSLVVPVDTRIKQPPKKKVYTVKRGDSLSVIAKRHGVSTRALAEENRRKPNQTIVIGQTLTIPLSPAQKATGSRKPEDRKHRVKSGDTLLGLAHRYGVSARSIAQANGRRETQAIFAGETLSIPPAEPRPTKKRR